MIPATQADRFLPSPRWTLKGGEVGAQSDLPPSNRMLIQIDGDLMGGVLKLDAAIAPGSLATLDVLRRPGIYEIFPVRSIVPSFDGDEAASITVTIVGLP